MKIITANATYADPTDMHPYKFMEKIGRVCYKSEDNITDESATKFVQRLCKSGHTAMLEHAHIIIDIDQKSLMDIMDIMDEIAVGVDITGTIVSIRNYFNITVTANKNYLSGSFRSFITLCEAPIRYNKNAIIALYRLLNETYPELFTIYDDTPGTNYSMSAKIVSREKFKNDVNEIFDAETAKNIIMKHLVHTVHFICDRGVSHEFVRHRPASFAQESTRYCNYIKDKFGNELTVIVPSFWNKEALAADESGDLSNRYLIWKNACEFAEKQYFRLIESGAKPQEARDVLPTSIKTELIITANEIEWQHMINLRQHGTTGAPHPQMLECMNIITPELISHSDNRLF